MKSLSHIYRSKYGSEMLQADAGEVAWTPHVPVTVKAGVYASEFTRAAAGVQVQVPVPVRGAGRVRGRNSTVTATVYLFVNRGDTNFNTDIKNSSDPVLRLDCEEHGKDLWFDLYNGEKLAEANMRGRGHGRDASATRGFVSSCKRHTKTAASVGASKATLGIGGRGHGAGSVDVVVPLEARGFGAGR